MPVKDKTPWLKVGVNCVECERCGLKTPFPMPIEIRTLVKYLKGISAAHERCEAPR